MSNELKKQCGHDHCHEHEHSHENSNVKIETCGCDHCHDGGEENGKVQIAVTITGALLIAASFLPFFSDTVSSILLVAATLICGLPIFVDGLKAAFKLKINESFLLVIAVIAAAFLGEFFEAAVVSVLFRIGEVMEDYASNKSRKSIESIFSIISDTAHIVAEDGTVTKVDADEVEIGDILEILPHEIVPVDGVVIKGLGNMDASALTGESLPVEVSEGSAVSSGMMNGDSTVRIRATAKKSQSSAARIVEMVEEAAKKKGKAQRAVTTFAKYYTPAIIAAAVIIAVAPSLITGDWESWIYRSLILLVASCPCAVVISAPLAFFSSMGAAAKNGMIIKASSNIEAFAKADTAVFDKTGTLTTGQLKIGKIYPGAGYNNDDAINLAAKCEFNSTHPIAKAIVAANGETDISDCEGFTETAGGGTSVKTSSGTILCGGERLMAQNGVDISDLPKAPVYVALNGKSVGAIAIEGEIRADAPSTIKKLRKLGIENMVMLTGDSAEQARSVCVQCGIDDFRSGLLPDDKLAALEEIMDGANGVIYVGDGINDAPVLAAADIGVAMGLGTQTACEAGDVILTNSDLTRLADTVYQSKRTMSVLKANIAFAIIVKMVVVALGVAGFAPMWAAILADVGTMIISVLNSSRLLKVKRF